MTDSPRGPAPATLDLNQLVRVANGLVAVLLVWALLAVEPNEYVNRVTIALGLLLCIQTHVALQIERLRRDPFVILVAFGMVFYYALRIFSLALLPYSIVFDRLGFEAGDSAYALTFILVANVFLYAGFLAVRPPQQLRIEAAEWRPTSPRAAVALMLAAFIMAYSSGNFFTVDRLPRVLTVLVTLLSPAIIVALSLTYLLVLRQALDRPARIAIVLLLVLEIAAHTLWGSRSAIVVFVQTFLLVGLAVHGAIRFKRRHIVLGAVLAPVIAAVMVAAFAISTYNRLARQATGDRALDVSASIESARTGRSQLLSQSIDVVLPPVLARAGFFDFSAEIIRHRDEYRTVINPATYVRSVIDNVLTPGLDVFDQPLISHSLRFVYLGRGAPSKAAVEESYHSDQLGIYGELYALFGFASLPVFFLIAYVLKRVYGAVRDENPFWLGIKRVIVLILFQKIMDSYGLDWIAGEMIPLIIGVALYSMFFSVKRGARRQGFTGPSYSPEPSPA